MSFVWDWFLPHESNNHKAHLIKPYSLFLLTFVFIFFQGFLNFFVLAKPAVLGYAANITPEAIIRLTNVERKNLGLTELSENKLLSEAASQKAADMFAFNYWAHVSPSGRTPWTFFSDVGYKYQYAGENLARDFKDSPSVVQAWMNSPSHKENVISAKYKEIGVAVVNGTLQGVETTLVVQLFGTQAGSAVVAKRPAAEAPKQVVLKNEEAQTKTPASKNSEVLTKGENASLPVSSPFDLTKGVTIFFIGILIGVFVLDIVLVSNCHTPRLSSKSVAQVLFLIAVLIASFVIKQGSIL